MSPAEKATMVIFGMLLGGSGIASILMAIDLFKQGGLIK